MTADLVAVFDTWRVAGQGFDSASRALGKAADQLCDELTAAGAAWGHDELGRAFFNGGGGKPGFGTSRDEVLPLIGDMVNVLAGSGDALVAARAVYLDAEQANVQLSGGRASGKATVPVPPAGGSYRLPPFTGGMVADDRPPAGLEWMMNLVASLVAGCEWPDGSISGLEKISSALSGMATAMGPVIQDVRDASAQVTGSNIGQGQQSFATFSAVVIQALEQLQEACHGLASSVDNLVAQKKAAWIQLIASMVFLVASFFVAQAIAVWTLGGSEAEFFATAEAEGWTLRMFFQLLAKGVLEGLWYGGGMDAVGQVSRIITGAQHGWNWAEFGKAAGEGAVAGAVMSGLSGAARIAGGRAGVVKALFNVMDGKVDDPSAMTKLAGFGARVGFNSATGFAGNVASQAAFDDGNVNWTQAGSFAVGMAVMGEGINLLTPGDRDKGPDPDPPDPRDPPDPPDPPGIARSDAPTAIDDARTPSRVQAALGTTLHDPSASDPGGPGVTDSDDKPPPPPPPPPAMRAGHSDDSSPAPTPETGTGSETGQGVSALAGVPLHTAQDLTVPAAVHAPGPDAPDSAVAHPAVLASAADLGLRADGTPQAGPAPVFASAGTASGASIAVGSGWATGVAADPHAAEAIPAEGTVVAAGRPADEPGTLAAANQGQAAEDPAGAAARHLPGDEGAAGHEAVTGRHATGRDVADHDPGQPQSGGRHRAQDPASSDGAHRQATPLQDGPPFEVRPNIAAVDPAHAENIRLLNHALASGIAEERTPGVEGKAGDTAIVTFTDGSKWVRKRIVINKFSYANGPDREELAYYVSSALDAGTPAVIRTSPEEFWMPFVEGRVAAERIPIEFPERTYKDPGYPGFVDRYANTDRGLRIAILDYVTSNPDRHHGNWMIGPDEQPIPIDHGQAWGRKILNAEFLAKYPYHTAFISRMTPERLGSLSADQWDTMQQKLEALKPVFDEKGNEAQDWYKSTMTKFAELRGKAEKLNSSDTRSTADGPGQDAAGNPVRQDTRSADTAAPGDDTAASHLPDARNPGEAAVKNGSVGPQRRGDSGERAGPPAGGLAGAESPIKPEHRLPDPAESNPAGDGGDRPTDAANTPPGHGGHDDAYAGRHRTGADTPASENGQPQATENGRADGAASPPAENPALTAAGIPRAHDPRTVAPGEGRAASAARESANAARPEAGPAAHPDPGHDGIPPSLNHIIADHPGLLDAPRSIGELKKTLGTGASFDDMNALRALSYRRNGIEPPELSRESLDGFLKKIWNARSTIKGYNDIYNEYSRGSATEENPLTRSAGSYLNEIAGIVKGRDAPSIVQAAGGFARITPEDADAIGANAGFVHFVRGDRSGITAQRVYVNARADSAPALMRALVHEVVDDPDRFPGVRSAKISGPRHQGRADNIVIYTTGDAANQAVISWLKEYRQSQPDAFMWSVPAMTKQVMEGVGTGAEPLAARSSFGSIRSKAIYQALQSAMQQRDDFALFHELGLNALREAEVDPQVPHLNRTGG